MPPHRGKTENNTHTHTRRYTHSHTNALNCNAYNDISVIFQLQIVYFTASIANLQLDNNRDSFLPHWEKHQQSVCLRKHGFAAYGEWPEWWRRWRQRGRRRRKCSWWRPQWNWFSAISANNRDKYSKSPTKWWVVAWGVPKLCLPMTNHSTL